eukprot:NODE_1782_length_2375_cov_4.844306.p1 GENE.NODE_1782_length_2375_cov_4.844306~~NODE_1782_length_2375_cov_4.844306.p1  ORF type:complete len:421 (-),score=90.36 NODE_1782_length_2375_cov_4.844306:357-1619(-)
MRIAAEGRNFVCGNDVNWNLFDTVLIASSVLELVAASAGQRIGFNLSVFRIFRIFRLFRLLRIIRTTPFLQSLNTMVTGVINCFAPIFWALFLLIIIMYGFAVFFISAVVNFLVGKEPGELTDQVATLEDSFGTIYRTIMVLFEGVTGGRDWADLSAPLKSISEFYYLIFAMYIVFVALGVLNIVTGFFVDGTIQNSIETREDLVEMRRAEKEMMMNMLREILHHMDSDGSGTLSEDELDEHIDTSEVQDVLCKIEFDPTDAKELFRVLDYKACGEVTIEAFTAGMLRLVSGTNARMDTTTILYQNMKVINMLDVLGETVNTFGAKCILTDAAAPVSNGGRRNVLGSALALAPTPSDDQSNSKKRPGDISARVAATTAAAPPMPVPALPTSAWPPVSLANMGPDVGQEELICEPGAPMLV